MRKSSCLLIRKESLRSKRKRSLPDSFLINKKLRCKNAFISDFYTNKFSKF